MGKEINERDGERDGENLTENQKKIIQEIKRNPFITAEALAKKIDINKRNVEKNLSKLQSEEIGLISRVGSARGGKWEVLR